jgi:hypothetical protein
MGSVPVLWIRSRIQISKDPKLFRGPEPELAVMDQGPELDLNLSKIIKKLAI